MMSDETQTSRGVFFISPPALTQSYTDLATKRQVLAVHTDAQKRAWPVCVSSTKSELSRAWRFCVSRPERGMMSDDPARAAVYRAVRAGKMPPVNSLTCQECGNPATGYHHHNGYDKEHWLDVIPLCTACHIKAHGGRYTRD